MVETSKLFLRDELFPFEVGWFIEHKLSEEKVEHVNAAKK
jgi:hypothetical protein